MSNAELAAMQLLSLVVVSLTQILVLYPSLVTKSAAQTKRATSTCGQVRQRRIDQVLVFLPRSTLPVAF